MLTLLFGVFFASSTDVMANFFQLPLIDVLWFFRFFVPIAPIVAFFPDLQDLPGDGGRPRASASASGPSSSSGPPRVSTQTTESPVRPRPRP